MDRLADPRSRRSLRRVRAPTGYAADPRRHRLSSAARRRSSASIGESGSGKTVLSRALVNWLPDSLAYTERVASMFAGQDYRSRRPPTSTSGVGRDIAYIGSEAAELARSDHPGRQPDRREAAQRASGMQSDAKCRDRVIELARRGSHSLAQGALTGISRRNSPAA